MLGLVGGSGVIGEELITSFGKKKIILNADKWESGDINNLNGADISSTNRVRTIDFIAVKPNTEYLVKGDKHNNIGLRPYTKDGDYIKLSPLVYGLQEFSFVTQENCRKIKLIYECSNPNVIIKKV